MFGKIGIGAAWFVCWIALSFSISSGQQIELFVDADATREEKGDVAKLPEPSQLSLGKHTSHDKTFSLADFFPR